MAGTQDKESALERYWRARRIEQALREAAMLKLLGDELTPNDAESMIAAVNIPGGDAPWAMDPAAWRRFR
jgi:hypothetical protein